MNVKTNWWKYLGAIILLYVCTAGLLIPLKPGIQEVTPLRLRTTTSAELIITGYNTDFANVTYEAFIRIDANNQLKAQSIEVINDQQIRANFDIPNKLPDGQLQVDATLVLTDGGSRNAIYPLLRLTQSEVFDADQPGNWGKVLNVKDQEWKFAFPYRNILVETIRNTFFHVAIWMSMFILLAIAVVRSMRYLMSGNIIHDQKASAYTYIAIVFGVIGVITGSIWARFTWGAYWTNDVKLNMVAISMMIYIAYGILRSSIDDHDKKAKSTAIYNIFAFVAALVLIMVIPRMTDSLHPGNGGNPAFGSDDMDGTLKLVFYPAVIGLALIGGWIAQLWYRIRHIEETIINKTLED